jgi:hypothetical protein
VFHLALEKLPAGAAVHAVADEGIAIRNIAEVIGRPERPRRVPGHRLKRRADPTPGAEPSVSINPC